MHFQLQHGLLPAQGCSFRPDELRPLPQFPSLKHFRSAMPSAPCSPGMLSPSATHTCGTNLFSTGKPVVTSSPWWCAIFMGQRNQSLSTSSVSLSAGDTSTQQGPGTLLAAGAWSAPSLASRVAGCSIPSVVLAAGRSSPSRCYLPIPPLATNHSTNQLPQSSASGTQQKHSLTTISGCVTLGSFGLRILLTPDGSVSGQNQPSLQSVTACSLHWKACRQPHTQGKAQHDIACTHHPARQHSKAAVHLNIVPALAEHAWRHVRRAACCASAAVAAPATCATCPLTSKCTCPSTQVTSTVTDLGPSSCCMAAIAWICVERGQAAAAAAAARGGQRHRKCGQCLKTAQCLNTVQQCSNIPA